jgi:hypothetical protein
VAAGGIRQANLKGDPMNARNAYASDIAVVHGENSGALFACGMWLRAGFVGASAAVAGVVALFGGDGTPLSALALAVGGAALMVFGWRRAYAAVDAAGRPETAAGSSASVGVRTAAGA